MGVCKDLMTVFLSAFFIDRYILDRCPDISPYPCIAGQRRRCIGISCSLTLTALLAAVTARLLRHLLPEQLGPQFIRTAVLIPVIALTAEGLARLMKKAAPSLYHRIGVPPPLTAVNAAVIGAVFHNMTDGYPFWEAVAAALGCGFGCMLAAMLFLGLRSRMDDADIPVCLRGAAVSWIVLSFISLAFLGFEGIIGSIFG